MKFLFLVFFLITSTFCYGQIDKDKLALEISNADAANTEKLKAFIWKRHSTATVDGVVKATVITEFSYNEKGQMQATVIGGETSVKQKSSGKTKANMDYVEKALKQAMSYTFMNKGQLLDFFSKAVATEANGVIEATAENVYMKGDKLTIQVDAATKLYINRKFSSLLDKDPISGEIRYEKFSSGINRVSETILNLPVKKAVINAKNQDYSQRVN